MSLVFATCRQYIDIEVFYLADFECRHQRYYYNFVLDEF